MSLFAIVDNIFITFYIGTIEMPIGTNNWDVETYRNKLEKLGFS